MMQFEDNPEILAHSENKELMLELRSAILNKFPGTWLLVWTDLAKPHWGIELLSDWGGPSSDKKKAPVAEFVHNWLIDHKGCNISKTE